jgi:transcriptional regulator with XRE-family HTH domain
MPIQINLPLPTEIADWAKAARESLDLGQAEFAKLVGVSQSSVCRWETGEAVPEYPTLLAVQALIGNLGRATRDEAGRTSELRDEIDAAYDMLTVLDKAGDGIGGDIGHGVSAVALVARSALDNARSMVRVMGAK